MESRLLDSVPAGGLSLRTALELHRAWLEGEPGGAQATLAGLTFTELKLGAVVLSKAVLPNTTWIETDLTGADLSETNLRAADFRQAMLSGVDFSGAELSETRFDLAWMARANLSETTLYFSVLRQANLEDARLFDVRLQDCDLMGATMKRAAFQRR